MFTNGEKDLMDRILGDVGRPVVFLLGSGLTVQVSPGMSGVPGTQGMVELLKEALGDKADDTFRGAVADGDGGKAYRAGFARLVRVGGQEAGSLNNLGIKQYRLGRREESLATTEEALTLYRELASKRPDVFLSELATSLNNLGNMQSGLGQLEDALAATEEAVEILRELASKRPC